MRHLYILVFIVFSVHSIEDNNQKHGAPFISVGDDTACNIRLGNSKIQDAIDTGVQEIRIASNTTYTENLIIHDKNITLRGGFATCVEANNNTQTNTKITIDGINTNSNVIRITGNSQRNNVVLENLNLINGSGTPSYPGGGISALAADVSLNINNTNISSNTSSSFGGGIGVVIGNTDILINDTDILNNDAKTGGGISCIGENNSIVMSGDSGIYSNDANGIGGNGADGQGGGVYLRTGCQLDFRSGTYEENIGYIRGILDNNANAEGGGIYAESGAKVFLRGYEYCIEFDCDGNNSDPVSVTNNSSGNNNAGAFNGGGIFATGANTLVFISNGLMRGNNASGNGGAIAVIDQAQLIVKLLEADCWDLDQGKCNLIENNESSTNNGIGGAIYNESAIVDISATYVEQNRADFGTAIYTIGNTAITRIEGSVFSNNGRNGANDYSDQFVIRSFDGTSTTILHSTFADNQSKTAVFGISSGASTFSLLSSIVHDASTGDVLTANAGGTINIDCVIAHETASISTGTHLLAEDPDFINGYHIDAYTSPAVDFCNTQEIPQNNDIDNQPFGWDNINVTNIFGPFDVGADETYDNDGIFANGFE